METYRTLLNTLPADLAEVALVDAKVCAAAGDMSESYWYLLVRDGLAPKPAVRLSRYTRWRIADVRKFLVDFASKSNVERETFGLERVKKASQAAKAKRQQKALNTSVEAECGSSKELST